jgi:alanyl-tRNA synthetase
VVGESSVGSGSRRIEALVGIDAIHALNTEREIVRKLSATLKAPVDQIEERINATLTELKQAQRELAELKSQTAKALVPELVAAAETRSDIRVVARALDGFDSDALRDLAAATRDELGPNSVVALGAVVDSKPIVMIAVGVAAIQKGIKAGDLAKAAASVLGGGGGGKPDMAQAGGPNSNSLGEALLAATKGF